MDYNFYPICPTQHRPVSGYKFSPLMRPASPASSSGNTDDASDLDQQWDFFVPHAVQPKQSPDKRSRHMSTLSGWEFPLPPALVAEGQSEGSSRSRQSSVSSVGTVSSGTTAFSRPSPGTRFNPDMQKEEPKFAGDDDKEASLKKFRGHERRLTMDGTYAMDSPTLPFEPVCSITVQEPTPKPVRTYSTARRDPKQAAYKHGLKLSDVSGLGITKAGQEFVHARSPSHDRQRSLLLSPTSTVAGSPVLPSSETFSFDSPEGYTETEPPASTLVRLGWLASPWLWVVAGWGMGENGRLQLKAKRSQPGDLRLVQKCIARQGRARQSSSAGHHRKSSSTFSALRFSSQETLPMSRKPNPSPPSSPVLREFALSSSVHHHNFQEESSFHNRFVSQPFEPKHARRFSSQGFIAQLHFGQNFHSTAPPLHPSVILARKLAIGSGVVITAVFIWALIMIFLHW